MFSIGWKTKFGYAVAELSRAKEHIKTLEVHVRELQASIDRLKEKHTAQCLDVNRLAGKIAGLEAIAAKREEAYRAQEDAYEDRHGPTTNQDHPEVQEIKGKVA